MGRGVRGGAGCPGGGGGDDGASAGSEDAADTGGHGDAGHTPDVGPGTGAGPLDGGPTVDSGPGDAGPGDGATDADPGDTSPSDTTEPSDAGPSDTTEPPDAAPDTATPVPPKVKFLAPKDGAAVQGVVPITLDVQDDEAGVTVTVTVNGDEIATLDGPPWETSWDTSGHIGGNYIIAAEATDSDGLASTAKVTVFLSTSCNDQGDCPPYNVKIINPVANAVVCGLVTVEAIADDDNGVVEMEFFVDGDSLGVDLDAPYQ